MKISCNWLHDYIHCDLSPARIAEILTSIGLEVEAIEQTEKVKGGLAGLVVAEVLTCTDHPDSDHLHVTTVDAGSVAEGPLQVVCGAPNVAAGQKVILATVGTTLYSPDGTEFKIKKSKIRGVESFGMICAEDEIGVGASHDGIIVLKDTQAAFANGTPAIEAFRAEAAGDTTFEIGLTPNRIDGASHYGVARDLAAWLRANGTAATAALPSIEAFQASAAAPKVRIENDAAAPRYMGVTMRGIKIAPSPEWLQERLLAVGLNPKNNVVDITNYVMFECGQPLHAFDLGKVGGAEIVVKNCPEGTPFVTLDGTERKLSSEDLMICSATRPMCLAGVFGGLDSGVSDTTTDIFIESAYFNPVSVRKSARRHGLNTDSSFRFERGADPDMAPYALKRAALLIAELAGGEISSSVFDHYPVRIEPYVFEVSYDRINRLIGKEIPEPTVKAILEGLEIGISHEGHAGFTATVPPYRVDVTREADVIEEILRIYGFNNIDDPAYIKNTMTQGVPPTTDRLVGMISELLVSNGATEIMSNSLTQASYYEGLLSYPAGNCVRILNPLSNELNVMRQTLLFGMLEAMQLNTNHRRGDLRLFEVGNCYRFDPAKQGEGLKPYGERQMLAFAATGLETQPIWQSPKPKSSDFFTVKSAAERILVRLGLNPYEGQWDTLESDLYGEAVGYTMRGKQLFELGTVSKKITAAFDLKNPVYYMEMNVEHLAAFAATVKVRVEELSKFPLVHRDLALLVDKGVTFTRLREASSKAGKKMLKSVSLFDVYEGDRLPQGKKSYALSFVIEDRTKTLTDPEIEAIMGQIAAALEKAGATVRTA